MKTALLLVAAILCGCTTNRETVMQNDAGAKRFCYLHDEHTFSSVGAAAEYNKCLNEAGAAGFKKIQ